MRNPKDGPPAAFPTNAIAPEYRGMTLRQWYAGQAMAALLVAHPNFGSQGVAKWAAEFADALIAEVVDQPGHPES